MFERPTKYTVALAAVVVLLAATGAPVVTATTNANTSETASPSTEASITNASMTNANAFAGSASFQPSVVREQRGDIANITVKTSDSATVNIGSPQQGFWMQVTVGGGTTTLRVNTYKAGQSNKYGLSEMVWASQGSIKGRTLRTASINAPLEAAQYSMNVTVNGQEKALGNLVVEKRATHGISARIAPESLKIDELKSASEIEAATREPWSQSIAHGDWLVLRVNASGTDGALKKQRLDGDGEHILVEFDQANPPMNAQSNDFYANNVARLVRDGTGEGFFLFVDTAEHDIEPGDRYNISFVIGKQSPLVDTREAVETSIHVAPRKVKIDRNGPGEEVVVEGKTKISGKTTLTPGTTINLTVRNSSVPPLFKTATMTVKPDRTFATTFDFSDEEPGRTFQIRLPDQRKTIPGVVAGVETTTPETTTPPTTTRPPTTTPDETDTPVQTTTTEPTTPATTAGYTQAAIGATESPLTERPLENASQSQEGGESLVPGFGVELAIVALAGAVLLARRSSGR